MKILQSALGVGVLIRVESLPELVQLLLPLLVLLALCIFQFSNHLEHSAPRGAVKALLEVYIQVILLLVRLILS